MSPSGVWINIYLDIYSSLSGPCLAAPRPTRNSSVFDERGKIVYSQVYIALVVIVGIIFLTVILKNPILLFDYKLNLVASYYVLWGLVGFCCLMFHSRGGG